MSFFSNLVQLWHESFPPDLSILSVALLAIGETLLIAFLATVLGAILSLPLAMLAAKNLFGRRINRVVRFILAMIRTLPALLWAVYFVILTGFGVLAGVLAMTFYSIGYLGKLQYEMIEGIDNSPLEVMKASGISKFDMIYHAVLPLAANGLISQLLFMFEYNIRASSILGFVGAGGIGFYISGYLKWLEYDKVFTLLLVVFFTIVLIDFLSEKIRNKWLAQS